MNTVENDAGVLYAKKGYYKGKEVTVTHHDGAMVWLEDYPIGKNPIEYGCWVPNESVSYEGIINSENVANKTENKWRTKKTRKSNKRVNSTSKQ